MSNGNRPHAACLPGDKSLKLMMRVQQDPADPKAWDEFVHSYQPMIRAWCLNREVRKLKGERG
jgi:hypothetical protein